MFLKEATVVKQYSSTKLFLLEGGNVQSQG